VRMAEELQKQKTKSKVEVIQKVSTTEIEAKELYLNGQLSKLNRMREDFGFGYEARRLRPVGIGQADNSRQPILIDEIQLDDYTINRDLSEIEQQAKQRWLAMDKRIDDLADKLGDNVNELRVRAQNIQSTLDRQDERLETLEINIDNTTKEIETSTKKLKKLLVTVREGDKCCVTMCLLLLLIGLMTVGYNMVFQ
jgi:hypothetical protein